MYMTIGLFSLNCCSQERILSTTVGRGSLPATAVMECAKNPDVTAQRVRS